MKLKVFLFAAFATVGGYAQENTAEKYGEMISPEHLRDYLSILASDALEGRETGKRGQKMAAALISSHFAELGLQPPVDGSYYQHFQLYTSYPQEMYIKAGKHVLNNFDGVIYYGKAIADSEVSLPVVFGGRGSDVQLEAAQAKGKAVLVMLEQGERSFGVVGRARTAGAKLILLVNTSSDEEFKTFGTGMTDFVRRMHRMSLTRPEDGEDMGIVYVAPSVASEIIKKDMKSLTAAANDADGSALKKIPPGSLLFKASGVKGVTTENVLGYLEGTDKKDELVIITAHYDHIGVLPGGTGDNINNGADDDGSGTSTVMELARVFESAASSGNGPRRSMLFMTFTGEEKGLLGSDYYTTHPVFPLSGTVVDLNIDMVGRRDEEHAESPPYVYVIGADKLSSELDVINKQANEKYTHLVFDYKYNDENDPQRLYYRSDHWNFAKNNVPVIFYFDGIHEDYHKPSDEVSKIDFDLLAQRAKCVFYTAWDVANRDNRITVDTGKLRKTGTEN